MHSASFHSPRPAPVFVPETPFSQRKKTPFRAPRPPRSPAKSCPPVSRVFSTPRNHSKPQIVSFKSERKPVLTSPLYDEHCHNSYFEQCFEVIEKLGEGSFGEVFKVRSKEDGKLYAVKRSRQGFRGECDRRQKLAEVEKHECLPPHPNCVRFHKAWEERQHLYIQTELCLMNLEEYADLHGRLPEYMVWRLLLDLVKGLKHLHDHRLCHLDIKPANIFVGQDGVTFKLGDFGLCVNIDQDFQDATEGDAKYVAPELLQGGFGKPADIFSLGISLLEVGCDLELPSCGQNWHQLREGHLPESFIKDLSRNLVNFLTSMMHPDPQLRPTVDELLSSMSVWRTQLKYSTLMTFHKMVDVCNWFCRGVWVLIAMLMNLLPGSHRPVQHEAVVHPISSSFPDQDKESFSDEDEDMLQEFLNQSPNKHHDTFNCSWIQYNSGIFIRQKFEVDFGCGYRNSPVKYPSPVYSGPPIPLNFGDTSAESSFDDSRHSHNHVFSEESPCRLHSTQNSPRTSLDFSFTSCTPNTKPLLSDEKRNKSLNIGPKNLMVAFEARHTV